MVLKLFNRKNLQTQWADKLAVREYVETKIGNRFLNQLIWSGESLVEVNINQLPQKFVIKANHSSGQNILVANKSNCDWPAIIETTSEWKKYDHSIGNGEWQYRWIVPKLMIERFLEEPGGGPPVDYKFFCFHGKVEFVQVDFDRFTNHTRTLFDRDFKALPFGILYETNHSLKECPGCFAEMVKSAEMLSGGHPFVRVDFYENEGTTIFGELTLHPGSGGEFFKPQGWDYQIGKLI